MRVFLLFLCVVAAAVASSLPLWHEFHKNDLSISSSSRVDVLADGSPSLLRFMQHHVGENRREVEPINNTAPCPAHPMPHRKPMPSPMPDAVQKAVDAVGQYLEAYMQKGLTGMSASLGYGGQSFAKFNFGFANVAQNKAPTSDTIFRIGSISKVFAVVSLLQAQERGFIGSIDDPVSLTVPDFSVINRFTSTPLTWRMLACQLSGLPREAPCVFEDCHYDTPEMVQMLHNTSTILPPWTRPSYSNLAYAIIGRLLEEKFGMTWERWVEEEIFKPLGMSSSYAAYSDQFADRLAQSYTARGAPQEQRTDLMWIRPAGSIFSTIDDMELFSRPFIRSMFDEDSAILKATSLKEMMMPAFLNQDGWSVFSYPWEAVIIDSYLVRCKGGNLDDFSGAMCVIPELGLSFNALWNNGMDEFDASIHALELIIPAIRSFNAAYAPPLRYPADPTPFTGTFSGIEGASAGLTKIVWNTTARELQVQQPGGVVLRMQWIEANRFAIIPPIGLAPCWTAELLAVAGEIMEYSEDLSTIVIPGYGVGVSQLYRVQ